VRIVGGAWRGRRLVAPAGRVTRPTSDRVREALFDALTARLGPGLGGGAVLDLYAGTGALGLEALSRGASRAVFVERDRAALRSLADNVAALGASDRVSVVAGDVDGGALRRALGMGPFALLTLDPPYRIEPADLQSCVGAAVADLTPDAVVAWEHPATTVPDAPPGLELERTYVHGDSAVTLYRRVEGA